jgi:hypothetical protein
MFSFGCEFCVPRGRKLFPSGLNINNKMQKKETLYYVFFMQITIGFFTHIHTI